jgi:serine/threonine protein kinase
MAEACSRCGLFHTSSGPCLSVSLPAGEAGGILQSGALLAGRYHIARAIHRGGMSTIYLAEDTKLMGRQVAVKEMRLAEDASDEERMEAEAWFAREAAVLSSVHHPLIPAFYSVFCESGRSYIVQEYIAGENLEDIVSQHGCVAPAIVTSWGLALCELLEYLHGLPDPIIFRDLKPANIVLRSSWSAPDRRLAVVDFGIARPFEGEIVGTVIGTPGYAPPEQYQGMATPQSDIYALGATLHRLLTGYDPERGGAFAFPPVRSLNPSVPAGLANAVARATSLNPADRFASATEMGAWLAARGPSAQAPAQGSAAKRPVGRPMEHAWLPAAVALVGSLLLSPLLFLFVSQPSDDWWGSGQTYDRLLFSPPEICSGSQTQGLLGCSQVPVPGAGNPWQGPAYSGFGATVTPICGRGSCVPRTGTQSRLQQSSLSSASSSAASGSATHTGSFW